MGSTLPEVGVSGEQLGEGGGLESEQERIERLGRQRPEIFKSLFAEIAFCFSIMISQIMAEYFISGFNVILPTLSTHFEIPAASSTWPASAFSLTAGSSLLIFGRLADMYGGYRVYLGGLSWYFIWSLIAGFAKNELMLDFCRALQGFGPAAFLSSGLGLLGSVYRPGPRKNLVFSIYGACAPLGFFFGIFMSGIAGQLMGWAWYFWLGAILIFVSVAIAAFAVPSDIQGDTPKGEVIKMDWLGAGLIFPGLILVIFAITDSAHAPHGWRTPYVPVTLIIGSLMLAAAIYVEGWIAPQPLLPADLFAVPQMKALILSLFFSYGVLGVWLLYATFYTENIMGASPLQLVAWFVPFGLGGLILSTGGGLVLHIIPGRILLILSGTAWVIANLLFAIAPAPGANYWAYTFPAMICGTLGIDITYNITNIFITTSLPQARQGLAGAVINSVLFLGISFFLGFADLVATNTLFDGYAGLAHSYKSAFWFALACAVVSVVVMAGFVRMNTAKSELTADEKVARELERQEQLSRGQTVGQEIVKDEEQMEERNAEKAQEQQRERGRERNPRPLTPPG
ncbi:MAG: hypothetical protein M1819_007106 [Sarea resinae]|nr:MAG: hypothetical protein M1819_007106 [Sarea resinae]